MTQKEIRKMFAMIDRWLERVYKERSRMWFANPDLCIFLSNYSKWGWRYLKKRGAKKGRFMLSVAWLTFSVAW